MSVHPCSQLYAEALIDPFGPVSSKEVCLPATLLPLPSLKFTTRCIVPWYTGTGGAGYLLFRPGRSWTSGQTCGAATLSGNTANTSTTFNNAAVAGQTATFSARSPFSMVPSGTDPRVRLVAFGTKTICATPGLSRGGMIVGVVNTNHIDLVGTAIGDTDVLPQAARKGFGSGDLDFRCNGGGPVKDTELEWQGPASNLLDPGYFGLFCVATAGSPQNFQTEIICYWEATGNLEGETSSDSDPGPSGTAGAIVQSAIFNNKSNSPHSGKWLSDTWNRVKSAWKDYGPSTSTISSMIKTGAAAAVQLALRSHPAAALAAQVAGSMGPRAIGGSPLSRSSASRK